ncbi:MAG: DUF4197 family protein [Flavobacteriales bacterium]
MKNSIILLALVGVVLLEATSCSNIQNSTNTSLKNSNVALNTVQNTLNGGLNSALNIFGDSQNFLSNALIEAVMPKELKDINSKLNDLGLSKIVDKEKALIGEIASASISTAKPIVKNTINSITTQDAINIISGGKGAATQFLRNKSYTQLTEAITPVVSSQMDQLGVNNLLGSALGGNNALNSILGSVLGGNQSALTQNLNETVTKQLVDGLFNVIEDAENTTRDNPAKVLKFISGGQ